MRQLLILVVLGLAAGCARESAVTADTGPFAKAIVVYLRKESMDLKIDEFKTLTTDGKQASAQVSLAAADETMARIKVRWTFQFEQQGDGGWRVASRQE